MKTLALLVAVAACGCAYNRPVLTETTTGTNGMITTRTLTMRSYVLWPASSELAKQKATLNGKSISVGTEGLGQDGGSTNVLETLRLFLELANKLSPK